MRRINWQCLQIILYERAYTVRLTLHCRKKDLLIFADNEYLLLTRLPYNFLVVLIPIAEIRNNCPMQQGLSRELYPVIFHSPHAKRRAQENEKGSIRKVSERLPLRYN